MSEYTVQVSKVEYRDSGDIVIHYAGEDDFSFTHVLEPPRKTRMVYKAHCVGGKVSVDEIEVYADTVGNYVSTGGKIVFCSPGELDRRGAFSTPAKALARLEGYYRESLGAAAANVQIIRRNLDLVLNAKMNLGPGTAKASGIDDNG